MRAKYSRLSSEDSEPCNISLSGNDIAFITDHSPRQVLKSRFCFKSLVFLVAISIFFVALYIYLNIDRPLIADFDHWHHSYEEALGNAQRVKLREHHLQFHKTASSRNNLSYPRMAKGLIRFNITGSDVLVFIHIQKTAGSFFENAITRHLKLIRPCFAMNKTAVNGSVVQLKRRICLRPTNRRSYWLYTRKSAGGWSCGVHADWTELATSKCVETYLDTQERRRVRRRYFYSTILRDPIQRFLSEFRHVQRGATWASSLHFCGGRPAHPTEIPLCYNPNKRWFNVTMDEFLDCPFNLAFNRQTRMLADLNMIGCYKDYFRSAIETRRSSNLTGSNLSESNSFLDDVSIKKILLASAKQNLRDMSFFGLQESMGKSQFLFEQTFKLYFDKQLISISKTTANSTLDYVSVEHIARIKKLNSLDIELYRFAKRLFQDRFETANNSYSVQS